MAQNVAHVVAGNVPDEFDLVEDDFDYAAIDEQDWTRMQEQSASSNNNIGNHPQAFPGHGPLRTVPNNNTQTSLSRSASIASTSSFYFDEDPNLLDENFLNECDAIAERAMSLSQNIAGSSRQPLTTTNIPNSSNPTKRPHSPGPHVSNKRLNMGKPEKKRHGDHDVAIRYDEELQCAICCDLLVAPHSANPCGHTVCGACGELWTGNYKNMTCPVCRTYLVRSNPFIPNIAMANVVDKHIQVLGDVNVDGNGDWQQGGKEFEAWEERRRNWEITQSQIAKPKPPQQTHTPLSTTYIPFQPQFSSNSSLNPASTLVGPRTSSLGTTYSAFQAQAAPTAPTRYGSIRVEQGGGFGSIFERLYPPGIFVDLTDDGGWDGQDSDEDD